MTYRFIFVNCSFSGEIVWGLGLWAFGVGGCVGWDFDGFQVLCFAVLEWVC